MKIGPLPTKSPTERRGIVRRPAFDSATPISWKQCIPEGHGCPARFAMWRASGPPADRTSALPGCAASRFTTGAWFRLHRIRETRWTPDGARRMQPVLAALLMLVASAAFAASESEYREHGAHEHGRGTLDMAVEGEELVIEFRVPAVNAVGFEHAPGTDAEREALRQALARFRDPAAVLVPSPGAECAPERAEAGFSGMGPEGSREHHEQHEEDGHGHERDSHEQDGHARGKHGHDRTGEGERGHEDGGGGHEHEEDGRARNKDEDEHHGHDEHHDGGHEPGEPGMDSGAEAHSELHATYHFHCHTPERLDRIQVRVFEFLHDAEVIEVRVVTPALQKAMDLHPGETIVELSR